MAYDVEDKVVQMRFDNRDFDPNIDASIKSLEKLEKSLQLANGTKGLDDVEKKAKHFNLDPAVTAVETLKHGFSALEVAAITAISNITNKAMAMGSKIVKAFALDPLTSGFSEYSEQMNSTQVILSNLSYETLQSVTRSLDELNEYADRTIYSFGQMTQAIGKFAAAGVNLRDATDAIQGLSSAAALVGANNQQLFSAYYNLAQAMQVGRMTLIDWKSLENSTIGNKTMRDAFVKTAIQMGKFTEESQTAQNAFNSFRDSISKDKWLTTDVIVETLGKYSRQIKEFEDGFYDVDAAGEKLRDDVTGEVLPALETITDATGEVVGYYSQVYGELEKWEVELASTAFKAATEIKSFKQMWETLTEAAGTGWAETWKIIFGDLEQAKELWTSIAHPIEQVISLFNNLRNEALETWAAMGGREDLVQSLVNLAEAFKSVMFLIAETVDKFIGFTETENGDINNFSKTLYKITHNLRLFTEFLIMSEEEVDELSDKLAFILQPLKFIGKVLGFIARAALAIIVIGFGVISVIGDLLSNLMIIPAIINDIFGEGTWDAIISTLEMVLSLLGNVFGLLVEGAYLIGTLAFTLLEPIKQILIAVLGLDEGASTLEVIMTFIGAAISFVIDKLNKLITVIRFVVDSILTFMNDGAVNINELLGANGEESAGFFVKGIVKGLSWGISKITSMAAYLGNALVMAFRGPDGIDAASPSKKGIKSGQFYVAGVDLALTKGVKVVSKSAEKLGSTVTKSTDKAIKDTSKIKRNNIQLDRIQQRVNEMRDIASHAYKYREQSEEELTVMQQIGKTLSNIGKTIWSFIENIGISKVLIVGFSVAMIGLIFSLSNTILNLGEIFEGVGWAIKATASRIWAEAFDQIGQALFSLAKSLAIIVLLARFDPAGLKQAVVILGIFVGIISALVFLFSRMITIGDKIKAIGKAADALKAFGSAVIKVFNIMSVSMLIASLAFSMMMLAEALQTIANIKTEDVWRSFAVVTLLLGVMSAIILVLNHFKVVYASALPIIIAYTIALRILSRALASIKDTITPYLDMISNMSKKQALILISLSASLALLNVSLAYAGKEMSKVILALTVFVVGLGIMAALMGIFQTNPIFESFMSSLITWDHALIVVATFGAIILIYTLSCMILTKVIKNAEIVSEKFNDTLINFRKILSTMTSAVTNIGLTILLLAVAFGVMNKIFGADIAKSAFGMAAKSIILITVLMAVMIGGLAVLAKVMNDHEVNVEIFDKFATVMRSISRSLIGIISITIVLTAFCMLFWHTYGDNLNKGFLVLATALGSLAFICGIISAMLVVIGRNFKGEEYKHIFAALLPIMGMITELLIALALFSTMKNPKELIPGILAINAVMAPIIALISQMNKLTYVATSIDKDGNKEFRTVGKLFGGLIAILTAVAFLVAEVATIAMFYSSGKANAFGVVTAIITLVATFAGIMFVMNQINKMIHQYSNFDGQISDNVTSILENVRDIIISISALIAVCAASIAGLGLLGPRSLIGLVNVLSIFGMIIAFMWALNALVKNLSGLRITDGEVIVSVLKSVQDILITIGAMILALTGSLFILKDVSVEGIFKKVATLMAGVTSSLVLVAGILVLVAQLYKQISNNGVNNEKILIFEGLVRTVIIFLANVSGLIGLLTASMYVLKGIPPLELFIRMGLLIASVTSILVSVAGLTVALVSIAKNLSEEDIGKFAALIFGFGAIMGSLIAIVGVITILSTVDTNKIKDVATLLAVAIGSMLVLGGIVVGLGFAAKALEQWSWVGLAIFVAMAAALIAFAGAVNILASSKLDALKTFFKELSNDDINKGLQRFVGAVWALSAALTLGGPGWIIAAGFVLALAFALNTLASTLTAITSMSSNITKLSTALAGLKNIILPLAGLLTVLTLFAPVIIILSLVLSVPIGLMALLSSALARLANSLGVIRSELLPFVKDLAEVGKYISESAESFGVLALSIAGFGVAFGVAMAAIGIGLLVAGPGLIMLATAIGIVITSLGIAAALLSPLVLTIVLALNSLIAVVSVFKDAVIQMFDHVVEVLPQITSLLTDMAPMADQIKIASEALAIFGAALILIGLGGVLSSIGILLLAGAIKVFDMVMDSVGVKVDILETLENIFIKLIANRDGIAGLGGALILIGLGLILIGTGTIVASLGLLAFAGAIKVLTLVTGTFDKFMESFRYLIESKDNIFGLGGALAVLGLGLVALGICSLIASIGVLAFGGALSVLTKATGTFDAFINAFKYLIENKDKIFGLGGALAVLGLGLVVLSGGLIALTIPIIILTAAATIFIAVLALIASICVTIVAPAISMIVLSLVPLVAMVNNCIISLTNLTNAVTTLAEAGNLEEVGKGLLWIALGFGAIAAVGLLISPLLPIVLLLIGILALLSLTLNILGTAIETFSSKLESSSTSISNAMLNISNAFLEACSNIKSGILEILSLASAGGSAAGYFIQGFVGTMASSIPMIFGSTETAGAAAVEGFVSDEALDENSPSIPAIEAAKYFVKGFVDTISNNNGNFFDAMQVAGKSAVAGYQSALESDDAIGISAWVYKASKNATTEKINNSKILQGGKNLWNTIKGFGSGQTPEWFNNLFGKNSKWLKAWDTAKKIIKGDFDWSELANKIGLDKLKKSIEEVIPDVEDYTSGMCDMADAATATKGTIESLTDTLTNQMRIFERFTADEEMIDPKELIHNMESQLRGMENWAHGIDILTARGMSGPLLQYLSEMGPQGYKYVEAFLEMTESEFAQANDLYSQSLSMPSDVANQIADDYRQVGIEIVEATNSSLSGIGSASQQAKQTIIDGASEAGQAVVNQSIESGTLTVQKIRELAGEAGADGIIYYSDQLKEWIGSAEYEELKDQLGAVFAFNAGDLMSKTANKTKKQLETTTHSLFDTNWLNSISTSDASYYINGFGDALTGDQYIAKCMEAGYLISATVENGINAEATGNKAGSDVLNSMNDVFNDGANQARLYGSVDNMLKNTIGQAVTDATDDAKEAGKNYVLGFAEGIEDPQTGETVKNKTGKYFKSVNDHLQHDILMERSPSELTYGFGKNYVLGFVNAVADYARMAEDETGMMGEASVASLSDTIQAISAQFTDDMDTTPTIRPVLDLDNVYTGMADLDTMFSTNQARIAGSAYMTTHDDSVERLEDAYRKAIMDGNLELANMLLNSENTNVTVEVHLDANAEGIFDLVKTENKKATERSGASPLMIAKRNALNAGLA